jgi:hypothetical protein
MLKKFFGLVFFSVIIIAFPLFGHELTRLDEFGTGDIDHPNFIINLYITKDCSVCSTQIAVLEKCVSKEKIAVFLEGPREEELRFYVKRKKIPYKSFLLTSKAKSSLKFGSVSPAITIRKKDSLNNLEGLQDCEKISRHL